MSQGAAGPISSSQGAYQNDNGLDAAQHGAMQLAQLSQQPGMMGMVGPGMQVRGRAYTHVVLVILLLEVPGTLCGCMHYGHSATKRRAIKVLSLAAAFHVAERLTFDLCIQMANMGFPQQQQQMMPQPGMPGYNGMQMGYQQQHPGAPPQ